MPHKEGFAKGVTTVDYPGVDGAIPLLSSFYFRFEKEGSSSALDNHINTIRLFPAGDSKDLSPNADLAPSQVAPGKLEMTFMDREADSKSDRYFYKMDHFMLPFANARRFQFRDVGCVGKCEQVLPHASGPNIPGFEPLFVLCGFKVFFVPSSKDHHLDSLAVYEDNGKLTVEFNDRNDDDTFGYLVDYALVNRVGTNMVLGEASGNAVGGARVTIDSGPKVIRGFRFDLRKKDHEVREVGVITGNDRVEVYYSDQKDEESDRFDWFVRWASVAPIITDPNP